MEGKAATSAALSGSGVCCCRLPASGNILPVSGNAVAAAVAAVRAGNSDVSTEEKAGSALSPFPAAGANAAPALAAGAAGANKDKADE